MEEKLKQIKNYSFHVEILYMPEEVFWGQARAMKNLWNAMVEIRRNFLESVEPLYQKEIDEEKVLKEFRPTIKEFYVNLTDKKRAVISGKPEPMLWNELNLTQIKKLRWMIFDSDLVKLTQQEDWKNLLGWEAREVVLKRFRISSNQNAKKGVTLEPKPAHLNQISFYHRFSMGGMDTEKIFLGLSKKISLNPVPDEFYADQGYQNRKSRYAKGVFGIGSKDQPLEISVYLHRQLPEGKLKTVQFVGRFSDITREWTWQIIFTIQTEEVDEIRPLKPVAALDLNWRRIDDNFLRIGFIKDTANNTYEIRLPLIEPPNKRARHTLKNVNKGRKMNNLDPLKMQDLFPGSIFELNDWNQKVDTLVNVVKHDIKTILKQQSDTDKFPEHLQNFLRHYDRIGRRGLLKLKWQIGETQEEAEKTDYVPDILQKLENYQEQDYKKRIMIHKAIKHMTNKRNKFYENLALWLRNSYSHLIWEGDLSLQAMAEEAPKISMNSPKAGIKRGNKFRQFAGLSILRMRLKEHDQPFGGWLINIKANNTTRRCRVCGSLTEPTAALMISCENGHAIDQDDNSCSNMLEAGFSENEIDYNKQKGAIAIPEHLRKFIIPFEIQV